MELLRNSEFEKGCPAYIARTMFMPSDGLKQTLLRVQLLPCCPSEHRLKKRNIEPDATLAVHLLGLVHTVRIARGTRLLGAWTGMQQLASTTASPRVSQKLATKNAQSGPTSHMRLSNTV